MSAADQDQAGPSGARPRAMFPCYPVAVSPGGTQRMESDAPVLYADSGSGLRPWIPDTTPVLMSPASSAGESRQAAPAAGTASRSRRSLNLSDIDIFNALFDSGSDGETEAEEEGEDDDDAEDLSNEVVHQLRDVARRLRDSIVEEKPPLAAEQADSMEIDNPPVAVIGNRDRAFVWSEDFGTFRGQKEPFTREPGPTYSSQDPTDLFCKIWDPAFMETVAKETNEYAWAIILRLSDPDVGPGIHEYLESWTDVTVGELYRYFAVLLQDYCDVGTMGMPDFRCIMSRNRFILITKFLHFVSNDTISSTGYARKIGKVAPVVAHCNQRFSELYTPAQYLSLDESLLLWKGRLSWKQCIRSKAKAARFGIKSFELCEAETGYMLQCRLYTGQNVDMYGQPLHGFQDHTAKVVLDLIQGYLNAGHVLVMDNWYNQLPLTRYLISQQTDVLGTISRRRCGIPQDLKDLMPNRVERGAMVHERGVRL